ncbi:hypothetical protein SeseC_01047 [Streptococcus equi subsp. zooepidemicus ATCC 35246]|nr:hypothetical protein SeseC_01047 [Streptococcus equi subsp. zooepidemicus ATCC 35246]
MRRSTPLDPRSSHNMTPKLAAIHLERPHKKLVQAKDRLKVF